MTGIIIYSLVIMALLLSCWGYNKAKQNKTEAVIPFKESIDLVGCPIVTFINNGQKLHFLLDTGSDDSYITSSIVDELEVKERSDVESPVIAGGGNMTSKGTVVMDIIYKHMTFENMFKINDLDDTFNEAFGDRGITVHGILGSFFFNKYNYILDFKELQATSKNGKDNKASL
jgi:hypothetical protein